MFGLTESALLFRRIGQQGGAPAYADAGIACACRTEPAFGRSFSGNSAERTVDTRIYLRVEVVPGDRVQTGGIRYEVADVSVCRAFGAVHHYEALCRAVSE